MTVDRREHSAYALLHTTIVHRPYASCADWQIASPPALYDVYFIVYRFNEDGVASERP